MSYSSRLEVRSQTTGALTAVTASVTSEVGELLTRSGFSRRPEGEVSRQKKYYPELLAIWGKSKGSLSRRYTTVSFHAQKDMLLLIVNSKDGGDKAEVVEIESALKRMFADKFPSLRIQVQAWSYLNTA